ncbi:MAG: GNAT family N-acetyltransferase, partial [Candidatus Aenigmarchaeota archaeon]|nr:GNAT family N-acetyltransferase [Candidatus Aenigmarchaeota archaeon]
MELRKARIQDAKNIQKLINDYAEKGMMLPRAITDIFSGIQNFFVVEDDGEIVACCSLRIYYPGIGEIMSLAVDENKTRHGIGTMLVQASIEEAKKVGITEIFTFTYVPEFFEKLGFE